MDLVVFEIGGVRYALPAADVREVLRMVTLVPLPHAPAIVEGIIDVRGVLVPVLDVRTRFRLPPKPVSHTDHLVLAWAGSRLVAIRADRVLALVAVDGRDVEDATAAVPDAAYVGGVARLPDGLVLMHDLRTFLHEAEGEALGAALGAAAPGGGA